MNELTETKQRLQQHGGSLVGYCRVSCDDQHCDVQIAKLKEIGCQKIYTDHKTGRTIDREELKKCLDYLRDGDVLAITRVDRLGRSLKDLINICYELKERGIDLYIIQQNIETSTSIGQMFYSMLGIISEFEYHLKRERQIEGIARAKKEGRYKGRKPLSHDIQGQIIQLKKENIKPTEIARRLAIGRTSVYKYLKQYNNESALQSVPL